MNLTYVIIEADDVPDVDFSQVFETSPSTLRYNIDPVGTRTFVKYHGQQPSFLQGKTVYSHSEILAILEGPEWTAGITGSP
jgi:hypothetical protein